MSKEYQIIYADPPWRYEFSKDNADKIEVHYSTMELSEIKNLWLDYEIGNVSKDAVLYLWATAPKLLEALSVMKEWGFTYRTQAIWDKGWIGMGYWFRGQHEILLVGIKGKVSPPIPSLRESSIFLEKKGKHSKKPDYFRNLIAKQFPDKNKIELFARQKTEGWDVWGNETEKII